MVQIKDLIEGVIRDLTTKNLGEKATDPQEWLKKTLTKAEMGHIKFHYFRKGILGVRVDSSAWMYSLSLKKEKLLSKIKGCNPSVKEIHFSLGDIK